MMEAWGYFLLGLLLLGLGGDSIVKGAAGLAQRIGLTPFVAGLLLMAFGTSLPELAVNARAVWTGADEMALGNAIGSNIVNLGLTLGAAAVAAPVLIRLRLLSPALVLLALASLLLMLFGLDGTISRGEGLSLLLLFVVLLGLALWRAPREQADVRASIAAFASTHSALWMNLLRVLVASALLYFGAKYVVSSTQVLGQGWGLTPLMVGLLPVAIGTALPEVAAAIAAARRGHGDMVAGHVIGSSVFNLLVIVGGMAAFRPLPLPESFVKLELPAAIALVLLMYPLLRGDLRISKGEGMVLLLAFAGWVILELALLLA
ncbi:sodium:calcium antiporter [Pseudoxanthomonas dokdonensis]|uniref:CaCA family Na+/Ca+ antiporter n=1 Tax=Pseudoxanthomonas dokdonensis TaxID=344882 RepID=A0A0R0CJB4_9GAMM|nr:sodium:calcium antiporter [Pseudoxanthomonas dokdonensis]KRG69579.1 CaCA family Na+/Ca+ antiporter [Pseudoxanthomonas dokdonensis]